MIRLTLNIRQNPEIHLFNKSTILIGSDATQADLVLKNSEIKGVHLKIIEQSGVFFALNLTHDPFLSINQLPFGKKQLINGDTIQLEQIEIQFENLNQVESSQKKMEKKQPGLSDSNLLPTTNSHLSQIALPFEEKNLDPLTDEEWHQEEIKQLLNETSIETPLTIQKEKSTQNDTPEIPALHKKISLKDDYLHDLDDEENKEEKKNLSESSAAPRSKKRLVIIILFFSVLLAFVVSSMVYINLSEKSKGQEIKAAQGVADIAMALTHAQLYHIKPHNQNWLDGDFLTSSLQSIIPNTHSYALNLDGHGRFNCCAYTLRIYTNRDLSRFLLIAQPVSDLVNGFISRSIIILDSDSMELRSFKDVRNINRLLANSEPLEGTKGNEISHLVKEGKLLRLAILGQDSHQLDFVPPKKVAWTKPGAENYIYNAPRYYLLTQNLLKKALSLSTSKSSGQEVASFKQDVLNFSRLKDLILYSDNQQSAQLAKKSVMLFAPSDNFLFGYLEFNHEQFVEAFLLSETTETPDTNFSEITPISEPVALADIVQTTAKKNSEENSEVDVNHPIYIQLQALVDNRENELRPLSAAIFYILSQELDAPKAHFQKEFQNIYHTYLITNSRHKQIIKEKIMQLYRQYEEMPVNQFVNFINEVNLSNLIMQKDETVSLVDESCIQNLENIFKHILKCQSILELDNLVHIALTWLNFDYLKDPQELIRYQNILRNHILDQLNAFIIKNNKLIPLKVEDKEILKHILDHERLVNLDEKEYFLAEYEVLTEKEKIEAHST